MSGKEFIFEERIICIIGCYYNCYIRLLNDEEYCIIFCYYCIFDINYFYLKIYDFGSINGIYFNGKKIGKI